MTDLERNAINTELSRLSRQKERAQKTIALADLNIQMYQKMLAAEMPKGAK